MKKLLSVLCAVVMLSLCACAAPEQPAVDTDAFYADGYDAGYAAGYSDGMAEAEAAIAAATPEPPTEPTPEPTPEPVLGSRKQPAKLNATVWITLKNDLGAIGVTLVDIVRGGDAWDMIYDANSYNESPLDGNEYVLAKFKIEYAEGVNPDDEPIECDRFDFSVFSPEYSELYGGSRTHESVVHPSPELECKLYGGASGEGWVAFEIAEGSNDHYAVFADMAWFVLSAE